MKHRVWVTATANPFTTGRSLSVIFAGFVKKYTVKNEFFKKFPVVTHKEIQVEIVPSELAKKNNDIEYYEIEFKGRKTPNKYNVKPNIKIVKLIGLQSDTRYLIKVFAVRNSSKSIFIPKIQLIGYWILYSKSNDFLSSIGSSCPSRANDSTASW